jgi:1-acyl-sn-glycerol-3-phosphate acyltransferase
MRRLGRESAEGVSPVVFPEGTRSRSGEVMPFHPGGVRMILTETILPITAVAVDGGHRFVSLGDIMKGLSTVTYRARLVGTFEHDGTKTGITSALAQAQAAVTAQIETWRTADQAQRLPGREV